MNETDWAMALEKEATEGGKRFTMKWYLDHPITKELLNSGILQGNVLDIGCGTGQRAFIAQENNECNIIGIDASEYAIDYANENFRGNKLRFINEDITATSFPDNYFDNAYMLAVIEHVLDTELLLSEIKRVLTPGGKLFLSVTENDYHASPEHEYSFSEASLREVFEKYKIINSFVKDHIIFMIVEMNDNSKL